MERQSVRCALLRRLILKIIETKYFYLKTIIKMVQGKEYGREFFLLTFAGFARKYNQQTDDNLNFVII